MQDEKAKAVFMKLFEGNQQIAKMAEASQDSTDAISSEMMTAMMDDMPIRQPLGFIPGTTREAPEQLLEALNQ